MKENETYKIIKKLVETNGNKQRAIVKIDCSNRHMNRLIKGYREHGKAFFVHGNRGKKSDAAIDQETRQSIVELYRTKYFDANFTQFAEFLEDKEEIKVSRTSITSMLREQHIISPKAHRCTKKALKAELKALQSETKSVQECKQIQSTVISLQEAHPRRPRYACFGELIQMDASLHKWFGGIKTQLHVAIDDATGKIVGAYFDYEETLHGYYNVLHQILNNYGIPYQFFTDNRTVFDYKRKNETRVEKDTFTQFGYACKQLGIDIKTSSVPQAKGRVERLFGTLQSRLISELRLANISSIEDANTFLTEYIKRFNEKFALPSENIKSVFEKQPDEQTINLLLAVLCSRKIDSGCCLKYQHDYYLPKNKNGHTVHQRKGVCATVIKAFDDKLFCCIETKIYALEKVAVRQKQSKNFDTSILADHALEQKHIPKMHHSWTQEAFKKHFSPSKNGAYV